MASSAAEAPIRVERVQPAPRPLVRLVNPVVRLVLASPLHVFLSRYFCLIRFAGRRTGREYSIPVTYWEGDADEDYDVAVVTRSNWWKNFQGGHEVRLRLRGATVHGVATAVPDDREVARFARARLAESPANARLLGLRIEGHRLPTVDELRPAVANTVLLRITVLDND
ncbi:nitroreductase/quinone reductase family protein [Haloarchaeobius amylolyticus]|uniref:nitroreductase/quinone reductase family protein n=1 Tax=Haloarchaeobius amylolyticus TaxID=1198296 RepID=UPI00226E8589|nr:nitroreductase/quinone reductase family protein [Haloarchaeobius amylolyticus]